MTGKLLYLPFFSLRILRVFNKCFLDVLVERKRTTKCLLYSNALSISLDLHTFRFLLHSSFKHLFYLLAKKCQMTIICLINLVNLMFVAVHFVLFYAEYGGTHFGCTICFFFNDFKEQQHIIWIFF